jgi:hypothetical protein
MSTLAGGGSGSPNTVIGMGPSPNQKNSWAQYPGEIIGGLIGGYFGGEMGAKGGALIGKQAGFEWGNIIAGRDAFNGGTGDFWDNLNPFSKYGMASLSANYQQSQAPMQMMQGMMPGLNTPLSGGGGLGGGMLSGGGGGFL